ncbi:hypothetical protein EMIHUDRAFT_200816 [Emiliania huxleyi CCMP1516]|uniref:J domain-containing protein n=2 Tax=Emiliania huxleyi TaxID=2903 RepID=A0A0D3KR72_EMIH1|nr:hypothetical protein EMIHUDRAFT_200816 [Emiliania huxleyi CCMP1516]EOD38257.1 hypothetical protein EMIHUDRAFT_200816 [Emiliania huxleyi CCMP1516]|eukprot:XP_005790686.1 hypothetical protein EMIHUDRAFT_200816 [Emiliania huxleyi CCMP1516]
MKIAAEPICVKQPLQALAGRSFERLCELGLSSRPASWYSAKEVKAAYRQLSLQLHPDKIRGASPEARREAENRFMRASPLGIEISTSSGFPERHSSVIAPAGHH